MKKINLVVVKGSGEYGGMDGVEYKDLISFGVTDLSPSDPDFLFGLKSLARIYASEFFDMYFDDSEKLLEKSKTLEEIQKIIKKELAEYGDYGCKWTRSIAIIEIKNENILDGLKHLGKNFFAENYHLDLKLKGLKKNKKFKEALKLNQSFDRLSEKRMTYLENVCKPISLR